MRSRDGRQLAHRSWFLLPCSRPRSLARSAYNQDALILDSFKRQTLMAEPILPSVEDRCVCIATKEGLALAAIVSSYFDEKDTYFAVFEFPSLEYPYTGASESENDGYYARVLGDKAAGEINNALARIQPDLILLFGMSTVEQSYIRARMPTKRLREIANLDEFLALFPAMTAEKDMLSCKPKQLVEGLLAAQSSGRRLRVDEGAELLPSEVIRGGAGILVLESSGDLHDIAAINYAATFNLDVVLIPPVDRDTIRTLPEVLAKWSRDNSYYGFKEFERKALKHIRHIDFRRYKFATFFTQGVPYGLFLKNMIPCSHVWRQIDSGIFIATNLTDDQNPRGFGSSLHFSPQFFPSEETNDVIRIFVENNFVTKALIGGAATTRNLTDFVGYYPYDVLHICSHGGETGGYYVVQTFKDRAGIEHRIEFYEVVQIDPVDTVMARLTRKMIYHRFDGYKWGSAALREMPQYVFEDMSQAMRADEESKVIRVSVNYPIAFSCSIQCRDGLHQGAFQTLSDLGRPLVFNNTCSSSHELAPIFVNAGARAYIGTLWEVGNDTATRAAKVFYTKALEGGNILSAFHEMLQQPTRKKDSNVYILWGLHFSSLQKPEQQSDDGIFGALMHSFLMWMQKISTSDDPEVKRNGMPILAFLYHQLILNFTQERLEKIQNFDPASVEEMIGNIPADDQDALSRGYDEQAVPPGIV
jgi:hypothetical protein